jgi:hypothetical protein
MGKTSCTDSRTHRLRAPRNRRAPESEILQEDVMTDDHPELAFVFEARVDIGPSEHVGNGAGDELDFTPITGGTVDGPRLRGTVLAGGGDWSVQRGPTVCELDAHYLIRAEDGALIDIVNRGFYRTTSEVAARIEVGEEADPRDVYFRTSPVFRTDAPAHRWLAETVFVGLARDEVGQVCIRFFEVL